jgi:hypothetical protein
LTEPSGDVATFVGSGIVIGGVAVLAAAPAAHAGDGYRDPSTASPTYGTSVGLLVPQVDQRCSAGVTRFIYDPTIVGEY